MKIVLLIVEVLFTGFMIWRNFERIESEKHSFLFRKIVKLAVIICVVNLFTIVGDITGLGYIPDLIFLVIAIIELTFGSL